MSTTSLKVRYYGDPVLRQPADPVKEVGIAERMLIQAMIATMREYKGIGLAAPQVGISQQIFVADVGEGPMVFVNPKIVASSGSEVLEEGCLSIPEVNIKVTRPTEITVEFTDENNQKHTKEFNELLAKVIQHENDHLHGKLIVDYASIPEKLKYRGVLKELEKQNKV